MTYHITEANLDGVAKSLLRALGSFYSSLSSDREFFAGLCRALVGSFVDVWKLTNQTNAIAWLDTPYLRKVYPVRKMQLKLSERQKTSTGFTWFELPDELLFDEMTLAIGKSSLVLTRGVDFQIEWWGDKLRVLFTVDLLAKFEDDLFVILDENNNAVDRFMEMYVQDPYTQSGSQDQNWGWLLQYPSVAEETDRKALFSLQAMLTKGPNLSELIEGLGYAFNSPSCQSSGETVKFIVTSNKELLIITDLNVYRFPPTATAIVAIGDKLKRGQQLTSAIEWCNLNKPGSINLPSLSLSQEELGSSYSSEIIFPNQLLATEVTTQSGYTKLTVPLQGDPQSVDMYWNEAHSRGISAGQTLAQYYDDRPNPVGEPSAVNLPTDLNPFELLLENVFRYNVILVIVDSRQVNRTNGYLFLAAASKLLPGHQALKVVLKHDMDAGLDPLPTGGDPQFGVVFAGEGGVEFWGTSSADGGYPALGEW